eukprot:202726-Chlamydomonas_euryale.AAC.8
MCPVFLTVSGLQRLPHRSHLHILQLLPPHALRPPPACCYSPAAARSVRPHPARCYSHAAHALWGRASPTAARSR